MPINRRTLLQILPASALVSQLAAQTDHCGNTVGASTQQSGPYQFQFFTPDEATLVDTLMEQIIPADQHSPGAHVARVVEFADFMLASDEEYVQRDWHAALAIIANSKTSPTDWLSRVSASEANPQTVEELFFQALKQMTINGYYSSSVGIHDDLRYQGNTYVRKFEGCAHPEHQG